VSFQAERRYINKSNDRVKENVLQKDAIDMPSKIKTFKAFQKQFNDKRYYEYAFLGYKILLDVKYAFNHFENNTYNDYRRNLSGTLYDLLHKPLLVVTEQNRQTLTFYKPYKNENKVLHMLMFQALKSDDGIYRFKTIYQASSVSKVKRIIKATDANTIYFKFS
jgi:hypothetical protein